MAKPIILEGFGRAEVTLGGAVKAGDLLGHDGTDWVKADADATTPIPARLIAAVGGQLGARITAFKQAIVEDADLALTVDGALYLSGTAGGVTQTAPPAAATLQQVVGRALSATRYELALSGGREPRYVRQAFTFPTVLPTGGTAAADALTSWTPGFRGRIESWAYVTTVAGTGTGATRTPNLEIGATDVTGTETGAIALADTDTVGKVKALGAPTAANQFDADDTISIEWAAGGTAFTAGSGYFVVVVRAEVAAA